MIKKFKLFESEFDDSETIDMIKDCAHNISDDYEVEISGSKNIFHLDIVYDTRPKDIPLSKKDEIKEFSDLKVKESDLYLRILEFVSRLQKLETFNVFHRYYSPREEEEEEGGKWVIKIVLYFKFNSLHNQKNIFELNGDIVSVDFALFDKLSNIHNLKTMNISSSTLEDGDAIVSIKVKFKAQLQTSDKQITNLSEKLMLDFPTVINYDYGDPDPGDASYIMNVYYDFIPSIKKVIIV